MIDLIENETFIRWPKTQLLQSLLKNHCRRLGRKETKGESPHKNWIEKETEYGKWFNDRLRIGSETEFGFVQSVRFYNLSDLQPEGQPK